MSEYGSLEDSDKLKQSMHVRTMLGETLGHVLDSLQRQCDNLYNELNVIVKPSGKIDTSWGDDTDKVAAIFDITRAGTETDVELKSRTKSRVATLESVTIDAILTMFEGIIGRKPYISEEFYTRVYVSGDPVDPTEGGSFRIIFEIPFTVAEEMHQVGPGDSYIEPANEMETSDTTVLNGAINDSVTTITVDSTALFLDQSDILIGTEYIHYESKTGTTFVGCNRGMYGTAPVPHSDNAIVTEATAIAWKYGTEDVVYSYHTSDKMYLTQTFPDGTRIRIRYGVSSSLSLSDLVNLLPVIESMGVEYRAAGVFSTFTIGKLMDEYFIGEIEVISLSDSETAVTIGMVESISIVSNNQVWDNNLWDDSVWGIGRWDNPTNSESYYLYADLS